MDKQTHCVIVNSRQYVSATTPKITTSTDKQLILPMSRELADSIARKLITAGKRATVALLSDARKK